MSELTVSIVVDPTFGDRLDAIAEHGPVWIAHTPTNRTAAERWWASHPRPATQQGVTTFQVAVDAPPERWCAEVLATVDMHYGGWDPEARSYAAVEVWGAAPVSELRAELAALGYSEIVPHANGFRASRVPAAG